MERMEKTWEFSSYLVKKFLKDEKRMRKEWERMGKNGKEKGQELNGKKMELNGGKWERQWRICEFALFEKNEDIWVCL